ncbi:MAG: acetyl-CoA carboxylase carboxyltransferase subunit alpha [Alphaproteobacteria bacterium]|nr:acetyl-CoA carboxylase carboxyltransferase subunit alpha [Alphaproteobacteria bacterium]MBE8219794.1 acetyl-CoA carboxylase carboxyltransferase subunit alpha [Alphaproteobacteria bacterium]
MQTYLDFEKPIAALEAQIRELRALVEEGAQQGAQEREAGIDIADNVRALEAKVATQIEALYKTLDPWQKTQVARHAGRPHTLDYIEALVEDFTPLAGDRLYGEDYAIIAGLGRIGGMRVALLGHEKGSDTQGRLHHNFGMARPEGYRKATRIMELADRFGLPLISLVDTAGAYPGIGAEERGQSEAIARCTDRSLRLGVPFVSIIIGEGGSGGALALASANHIFMLEHSIYTVASPEACASILWRSSQQADVAARALCITAQDLLRLKVIDAILPEPIGGAHRAREIMMEQVGNALTQEIMRLNALTPESLREQRRHKFLEMGRTLNM